MYGPDGLDADTISSPSCYFNSSVWRIKDDPLDNRPPPHSDMVRIMGKCQFSNFLSASKIPPSEDNIFSWFFNVTPDVASQYTTNILLELRDVT